MIMYKGIKAKGIIYQKLLLTIITSSSIKKNFYGKPIDSDIEWYEEIRKLTSGQGEDYAAGRLFSFYRLIAVDLRRQKN